MTAQLQLADFAPEQTAAPRTRGGFDPACAFLLELAPANLYEPTERDWIGRCKGCGATVERWNQQKHHGHHRRHARAYDQRRREQTDRERELLARALTIDAEGGEK